VLLALHGGSGTDDEDLRKAHGLQAGLAKQPDAVVAYKILPSAVESVKQVASSRLKLFNGELKFAKEGRVS